MHRLLGKKKHNHDNEYEHKEISSSSVQPTILTKNLASALPESVILPQDSAAFTQSQNSYWAQQEREAVPASVVKPRDTQELSTAIRIINQEYSERGGEPGAAGIFAVRSGGHSPVSGAASLSGRVIIDLGAFCSITVSEDQSSVNIGAGAKWADVYKVMDVKGLTVVGGRNSAVGVGGFLLGGMYRFASTFHNSTSPHLPRSLFRARFLG